MLFTKNLRFFQLIFLQQLQMTKLQQQSKTKKAHQPFISNTNSNKLKLNKYHQIATNRHNSEAKELNKRKRDLERLIEHLKKKKEQVDEQKIQELQQIQHQLEERKKRYEKKERKEFFIQAKYKQIKEIEMRKVVKKIRKLKSMELNEEARNELSQWEKKLRYIKYYPKNLKYVSLFPNSKPLDEGAIQFQNKIISDIEEKYAKSTEKMNTFISDTSINKKQRAHKKIHNDEFFIADEGEE